MSPTRTGDDDSPSSARLELTQAEPCLAAERENLIDCPNVLSYQRALETERGGYLIRQWVASNLYDRIR